MQKANYIGKKKENFKIWEGIIFKCWLNLSIMNLELHTGRWAVNPIVYHFTTVDDKYLINL